MSCDASRQGQQMLVEVPWHGLRECVYNTHALRCRMRALLAGPRHLYSLAIAWPSRSSRVVPAPCKSPAILQQTLGILPVPAPAAHLERAVAADAHAAAKTAGEAVGVPAQWRLAIGLRACETAAPDWRAPPRSVQPCKTSCLHSQAAEDVDADGLEEEDEWRKDGLEEANYAGHRAAALPAAEAKRVRT